MFLRIIRVDHDGANGRDHFPTDSDIGETVLVIGVETFVNVPDPAVTGQSWVDFECVSLTDRAGTKGCSTRMLTAAFDDPTETLEMLWKTVTRTGRVLELVDGEVELVEA